MKLAQRIDLWADKLRDISAKGLHFSRNPHDVENYQQLHDIAL